VIILDRYQALKILEISSGSSLEELKKAYRKKSKENHPDLKGQEFNEKFILINQAYEFLSENGTKIDVCKLTHQGNIIDIGL
jgi:molecular chaperone DnaJ